MEERVLVWAPPRDGQLTCAFLEEKGIACHVVRGWEEFQSEIRKPMGALLVASELLTPSAIALLEQVIASQPPWSDLPIVVVGGPESVLDTDALDWLGNVAVLQRPLSLDTLRSTVRAALRARRRQYEVRDLLDEKDDADRR